MAKKKGARKAAARGARKTTTSRGGTRRTAASASTRKTVQRTGLEHPRRVTFTPLKKIIGAHIKRLQKAPQGDDVKRALSLLQETKAQLGSICADNRVSMVIEF